MNLVLGTVFYNGLIVAVIWVGAIVALQGFRSQKFIRLAISFSAGILLGVAFLHMIPESMRLLGGAKAGLIILIGYLAIYVLERFVMVHPCEEAHCDYHTIGLTAFLGLSLHSFMGGLALGSALLVPSLGLAVFFATITHKAPEAFSLTSLLLLGERKRTQVLTYMAVFSAMVPLGSFVAISGLNSLGEKVIGGAIALSSGSFLHIATRDLLPGTHSKNHQKLLTMLVFLLGIGFAFVTKWMEPK